MIANIRTIFPIRREFPVGKVIANVWGALLAIWTQTPKNVQDGIQVAVWFFVMDTLTGYVLAAMEGRARSRTLFEGAIKKAMQYSSLVGLFAGIGVIAANRYIIFVGIGLVVMTEATSILENVYKMQSGGAKMPVGMDTLIARVGRYLAASGQGVSVAPPVENAPPQQTTTEEQHREGVISGERHEAKAET